MSFWPPTHPHGGKRARRHVYSTLRVSDPKRIPGKAVAWSDQQEGWETPSPSLGFPALRHSYGPPARAIGGMGGMREGTGWAVLKGAGVVVIPFIIYHPKVPDYER